MIVYGQPFEAKGDWMRLCWQCWRAREDRKKLEAEYDAGYRDGDWAGCAAAPTERYGQIDTSLPRELIQLCHPDRDLPERSLLANRATGRLLELLERERRPA